MEMNKELKQIIITREVEEMIYNADKLLKEGKVQESETKIQKAVNILWELSGKDLKEFKDITLDMLHMFKMNHLSRAALKNPILISSILKINPEMLYNLSEITQTNTENILNFLGDGVEKIVNKISEISDKLKKIININSIFYGEAKTNQVSEIIVTEKDDSVTIEKKLLENINQKTPHHEQKQPILLNSLIK